MALSLFKEVYFWFEMLAFLVAVIIVISGRAKHTVFTTLPVYLGYLVAFDIGLCFVEQDRLLTAAITNRLIIPSEFLYIQLLGFVLLRNRKLKNTVLFFTCAYLVMFIIDWSLLDLKRAGLYIRSYTVGVLGMVAVTIMLFYELLNSNRLLSFYKQPVFWLCAGVLIFYLGTLPIHIYWNLATKLDVAVLVKLKYIFDSMMCAMYLFFVISMLSFLWKKN